MVDDPLSSAFAAARARWGGNGTGSSDKNTKTLVDALPALLKRWNVRRLIDLGCGDVSWIAPIAAELEYYLGVDVVPQVISANEKAFPNLSFQTIRSPRDDFGSGADLVICRDCVAHLASSQVTAVLAQIARAAPLALITTHPATRANEDIKSGGYRPVNLMLRPFSLPAPIEWLVDSERKTMGLWRTLGFSRPRR